MEKYFDDKELGRVVIRYSERARNYTLKITKNIRPDLY